jgi:hypothetical protein
MNYTLVCTNESHRERKYTFRKYDYLELKSITLSIELRSGLIGFLYQIVVLFSLVDFIRNAQPSMRNHISRNHR